MWFVALIRVLTQSDQRLTCMGWGVILGMNLLRMAPEFTTC